MKIKLLLICLLFVTPQVFAETKSIQKLNNPDPIKIKEKDSRIALHFNNLNKMLMGLKKNGQNILDFLKKIERYTSPE